MAEQQTNPILLFIKRRIYKWHNIIGLITVIPVILWCLSGLMHPFMAHWFKPTIPHEVFFSKSIAKDKIIRPISDILSQNKIDSFKKIRVIQLNDSAYYQVKINNTDWLYFNTQSGHLLPDGDKLYAEFLARFFIEDSSSKILSIKQQTDFSQEYKYINRLLPVWKVSFDRPDRMDVYVETSHSRLGTFNPASRKIFLWIFDNFHNWSFLNSITNNTLRIAVISILLLIISFSAISGLVIYGIMWGKFKKPKSNNKRSILQKYHRQIGIIFSLFTITFALSGLYHAIQKISPNILPKMVYEPVIKPDNVTKKIDELPLEWDRFINFSIIKIKKEYWYQIFYQKDNDNPAQIVYFDANSGNNIPNGDFIYAEFLANKFASLAQNTDSSDCCELTGNSGESTFSAKLLGTDIVRSFEQREYGFAFKRLPVIRLRYDTPEQTNYYIETSSSRLAAKVENANRLEGYSFAIFHKFLLMDWAGKDIRDITTLLADMGVLAACLLGFILYLKKQKK